MIGNNQYNIKDVGNLDRRVKIISSTKTTNSFNEVVRADSLLAEVWGKVIWSIGDESLESAKETMTQSISVIIRHRSDINQTMKIEIEGQQYDVKSFFPWDTRRRGMYLRINATKSL